MTHQQTETTPQNPSPTKAQQAIAARTETDVPVHSLAEGQLGGLRPTQPTKPSTYDVMP